MKLVFLGFKILSYYHHWPPLLHRVREFSYFSRQWVFPPLLGWVVDSVFFFLFFFFCLVMVAGHVWEGLKKVTFFLVSSCVLICFPSVSTSVCSSFRLTSLASRRHTRVGGSTICVAWNLWGCYFVSMSCIQSLNNYKRMKSS